MVSRLFAHDTMSLLGVFLQHVLVELKITEPSVWSQPERVSMENLSVQEGHQDQ